MIAKKLDKKVIPCRTQETPLYGSTVNPAKYLEKNLKKDVKDLINIYGSKYEKVLEYMKRNKSYINAQIILCCGRRNGPNIRRFYASKNWYRNIR